MRRRQKLEASLDAVARRVRPADLPKFRQPAPGATPDDAVDALVGSSAPEDRPTPSRPPR